MKNIKTPFYHFIGKQPGQGHKKKICGGNWTYGNPQKD
jgi:hypothetical protein